MASTRSFVGARRLLTQIGALLSAQQGDEAFVERISTAASTRGASCQGDNPTKPPSRTCTVLTEHNSGLCAVAQYVRSFARPRIRTSIGNTKFQARVYLLDSWRPEGCRWVES